MFDSSHSGNENYPDLDTSGMSADDIARKNKMREIAARKTTSMARVVANLLHIEILSEDFIHGIDNREDLHTAIDTSINFFLGLQAYKSMTVMDVKRAFYVLYGHVPNIWAETHYNITRDFKDGGRLDSVLRNTLGYVPQNLIDSRNKFNLPVPISAVASAAVSGTSRKERINSPWNRLLELMESEGVPIDTSTIETRTVWEPSVPVVRSPTTSSGSVWDNPDMWDEYYKATMGCSAMNTVGPVCPVSRPTYISSMGDMNSSTMGTSDAQLSFVDLFGDGQTNGTPSHVDKLARDFGLDKKKD